MDEKLNNQDVLLVKEKDSDKLKVVSGIEKDGKPKSVEPQKENEPQFLRIDKSGNALDNFLSNFQRQYKDPTHFQFFKVPIEKAREIAIKLQEAFKSLTSLPIKQPLTHLKLNLLPRGKSNRLTPLSKIVSIGLNWSALVLLAKLLNEPKVWKQC